MTHIKLTYLLIICICCIGVGYLIGHLTITDSVRVVEKVDVKWVEKPEITFIVDVEPQLIPIGDVLIELNRSQIDTVYIKDSVVVSEMDTTFSSGAFLSVKHFADPFYKFKIDFKEAPEKIVTKYKTTTITRTRWIDYGLQVTAGYGLIHKQFDVTVGIGLRVWL